MIFLRLDFIVGKVKVAEDVNSLLVLTLDDEDADGVYAGTAVYTATELTNALIQKQLTLQNAEIVRKPPKKYVLKYRNCDAQTLGVLELPSIDSDEDGTIVTAALLPLAAIVADGSGLLGTDGNSGDVIGYLMCGADGVPVCYTPQYVAENFAELSIKYNPFVIKDGFADLRDPRTFPHIDEKYVYDCIHIDDNDNILIGLDDGVAAVEDSAEYAVDDTVDDTVDAEQNNEITEESIALSDDFNADITVPDFDTFENDTDFEDSIVDVTENDEVISVEDETDISETDVNESYTLDGSTSADTETNAEADYVENSDVDVLETVPVADVATDMLDIPEIEGVNSSEDESIVLRDVQGSNEADVINNANTDTQDFDAEEDFNATELDAINAEAELMNVDIDVTAATDTIDIGVVTDTADVDVPAIPVITVTTTEGTTELTFGKNTVADFIRAINLDGVNADTAESTILCDKPIVFSRDCATQVHDTAANTSLLSIVIPPEFDIAFGAAFFAKCSVLETYSNVRSTYISQGQFMQCTNLKNVIVGAIENVPDIAFYMCENFDATELIAQNDLKTIGIAAFMQTATTSVKMPKTLVKLSAIAFKSCKMLQQINFNQYIASNCGKMVSKFMQTTTITFDTIRTQDAYVFADCGDVKTNLTAESLEYIHKLLFGTLV